MFIDPKVAIENGWVTGITNPDKQIQPNAIDFTLDRLFDINGDNDFVIDETGKKMRGGKEIVPVEMPRLSDRFWWKLDTGIFDGLSNVFVDLPEGVACLPVIGRSTFNRNGIFITSGLYDSGYKGHIGFAIHNWLGRAQIGIGTRIGQLAFVKSEEAGLYKGGWNHGEGELAPHQEGDIMIGPGSDDYGEDPIR